MTSRVPNPVIRASSLILQTSFPNWEFPMSRLKLFAASVVVAAGIATATAALADRAAAPVARPAADRHGPTVYQTEAAMRAGVRWDYARFRFTPLQDEWSWRCGTFKVIGHPSKIYQSFGGPQRPIDGDIW